MNSFKIIHKSGTARVGELTTPHGIIETPNFVSVGTKASVKALSPQDLEEIGAQIILANTYHLMLQPKPEVIEKFGGLHKFMGWKGPIMTDSGGFQVFSLGVGLASGEEKVQSVELKVQSGKKQTKLAKVSEEGVTFQSHLDGSKYFLGPEESIKIQHQLGADLIVAFDDHESANFSYEETETSLELTERWALRSLKELKRLKSNQLMYGVVHGGLHKDLRVRSAKFTGENFEAISIGGIYGTKKDLYQIVEWVLGNVSEGKVRHLLGIGEIVDLFNGVERGVDMFDCVAPMRRARHGSLYIYPQNNGLTILNIHASKYINDKNPIDPFCSCYTCQNFSMAYLRHLFIAKELLYYKLATFHNVYFIVNLMKKIRESIKSGSFEKLKKEYMGI